MKSTKWIFTITAIFTLLFATSVFAQTTTQSAQTQQQSTQQQSTTQTSTQQTTTQTSTEALTQITTQTTTQTTTQAQPIKSIVSSIDISGTKKAGETITITPTVKYPVDGLQYKYVYRYGTDWSDWGLIKDFSSDKSATFTLPKSGNVYIYVDIKKDDYIANNAVLVKSLGNAVITGVSVSGAAQISTAQTVKPITTGIVSGYQYKYVYRYGNDWSDWGVIKDFSTSTSVSFAPSKEGPLTLYIDMKDPFGNITSSRLTQTVTKGATITSLSITGDRDGSTLTITPKLSADLNGKQLKYVYRYGNDWSDWGVIKDFSTSTSVTFTPKKAGVLHIYVDLGSNDHKTTTISTTNIETATLTNITLSGENMYVPGHSVTIKPVTSGNAHGYKFKYVYKYGSDWSNWGVIKDNSTSTSQIYYSTATGPLSLYVDMISPTGKITTIAKTINLATVGKVSSVSVTGTKEVGETLTITPKLTGTQGHSQYKYVYRYGNDWSDWGVIKDFSTSTSVTFTPKKAGTYTFYVDFGNENYKVSTTSTVSIEAKPELTGMILSPTSPAIGTQVAITPTTVGNTKGATFKYVYRYGDDWSDWGVIKDFSASTSVIHTTKKTGTLTIYVDMLLNGKTTSQRQTITVMNGGTSNITATLSHTSASIPVGQSFYTKVSNISPSGSSVKFISDNENIATVNSSKGYILGKAVGSTTIRLVDSQNRTIKTCSVNVVAAQSVRLSYSSPNSAARGSNVTLYAITDQTRTSVKFNVAGRGEFTATNKVAEGSTYVWSVSVNMPNSGTYTVTPYSMLNGSWTVGPETSKTSIYVTSSTSTSAQTNETKRTSSAGIGFIAECEGFSSTVYDDAYAPDAPTLGYGEVIYAGDYFYNNITKTEGMAMLVNLVNAGSYAKSVNNLLVGNGILFNQQQFDALVSFAYNVGTGWTSSSTVKNIILSSPSKNLANIDKDSFGASFNQWHHSGGVCVKGLLYRRINELEIFFEGSYSREIPPKNVYKFPVPDCIKL